MFEMTIKASVISGDIMLHAALAEFPTFVLLVCLVNPNSIFSFYKDFIQALFY